MSHDDQHSASKARRAPSAPEPTYVNTPGVSNGKPSDKRDWFSLALYGKFGDIPGKWVAAMDVDLAIYTKKSTVWLLEKKAMLGTLERTGVITMPLTQLLFLKQLSAKLDCHAMLVVYDLEQRTDTVYTLDVKGNSFQTMREGSRVMAIVPRERFTKRTMSKLVDYMREELRSTRWRTRVHQSHKKLADNEDQHKGHFVLCGNCGGVVSTHYHDDNPDFVLDPDVARDMLRLGLGECNCFVQLDLWCEKCQVLFS